MQIIKVDAIDSTNTYLRGLHRKKELTDPVCVIARHQLAGKGQMGTVWQSTPGKNLTCSVFMGVSELQLKDQFYISIATSLAIYDVFKHLMVPKLSIKWPNDILSYKQKICGILIENIVKNGRLTGAILGIGININQVVFDNLPQAGSLKQILGCNFDIDEITGLMLSSIENRFKTLSRSNFQQLKAEYEHSLFRKHKPSTFLDTEGEPFVGIIQNITNEGKLQVLLEDEIVSDFELKEIKLLY